MTTTKLSSTQDLGATLLRVALGVMFLAHAGLKVFTAPNGGWEYPVFLAVASVVQALLGDGAYALRWEASAGFRPLLNQ